MARQSCQGSAPLAETGCQVQDAFDQAAVERWRDLPRGRGDRQAVGDHQDHAGGPRHGRGGESLEACWSNFVIRYFPGRGGGATAQCERCHPEEGDPVGHLPQGDLNSTTNLPQGQIEPLEMLKDT